VNQRQARDEGAKNGYAAGRYAEVSDHDRKEADCECEGTAVCKDCLTTAAYQAEENARQFTPFEFTAKAINDSGDRAEGLWAAYDDGVRSGIAKGVRETLNR